MASKAVCPECHGIFRNYTFKGHKKCFRCHDEGYVSGGGVKKLKKWTNKA